MSAGSLDDFCCPVCFHSTWASCYSRRIMHPLWWLRDEADYMDLSYVICQSCGYITLFPRLDPDDYATYYRESPTPGREAFARRLPLFQSRKDYIAEHLPSGHRSQVVEVGPAFGDFLMLFDEFDSRVGIEPSALYGQHVRDSGLPLRYVPCMLDEVKTSEPELLEQADLAMASHVLEHALQPREFVRDMVQLVRPGGCVYIEVPAVESMAQVTTSAYQTVHFGHISQFSEGSLNQLCRSELLEPVRVELSTAWDYPAIRGLYRKNDRAVGIAEQFRQHTGSIDQAAVDAKDSLLDLLSRRNQCLLWGCGEDAWQVLGFLSDSELELLRSKVTLIDANPKKWHRKVTGMEIVGPDSASAADVDAVAVASRSNLLQKEIGQAARERFSGAEVVSLYCQLPD